MLYTYSIDDQISDTNGIVLKAAGSNSSVCSVDKNNYVIGHVLFVFCCCLCGNQFW